MKIVGAFGKNGLVSVDKIIAEVPNATSIEISESHLAPTLCATLVSMNRKAKISNLVLKNVTSSQFYKQDLFINFVLKNSDDRCNVYIDFKMIPEVDNLSREVNADIRKYRS